MIGDDVEITIVDIRGDKVRLGITAPIAVPVHRKEVYDAIRRENMAAAGMKPDDISQQGRSQVKPETRTGTTGSEKNNKEETPKKN